MTEIFWEIPESNLDPLAGALVKYYKIAIVGGPKCGKTTAVKDISGMCGTRAIIHTDEFKDLPWAEQPYAIIQTVANLPAFIVEGVQVARALRRGLKVDFVYAMFNPKVELTTRQAGMLKGIRNIFDNWRQSTQPAPF